MEEQLCGHWRNCQETCCDSPPIAGSTCHHCGCDTVAQLPGIGKITAINTLLAGQPLQMLGGGSSLKDIAAECTQFIAACYGSKKRDSMSQARIDVWSRKMAKPKLSKAPELKSLPPTTEAFEQNVRRAHIQTAIWKSANESDPPQLDLTEYGWVRDEASKSLLPITVPSEVKMAFVKRVQHFMII